MATAASFAIPVSDWGKPAAAVRTIRTAAMLAGHAATPPEYQFGPHGANVADTDDLQCRRVFMLPTSLAAAAVSIRPGGRFILFGFFLIFI